MQIYVIGRGRAILSCAAEGRTHQVAAKSESRQKTSQGGLKQHCHWFDKDPSRQSSGSEKPRPAVSDAH